METGGKVAPTSRASDATCNGIAAATPPAYLSATPRLWLRALRMQIEASRGAAEAMVALAQEMRERTDGADGCEKIVKNASLAEMKEAFTQLRRDEIWPGTLVTLFFSGHEAEHDGTHYLLPVGMPAAAIGRYGHTVWRLS